MRSSQKELKGGKKQKLARVDIDQQYLESMKEIGKRMEETSNDSDNVSAEPPSGNERAITFR
jgi:hypothetical protein